MLSKLSSSYLPVYRVFPSRTVPAGSHVRASTHNPISQTHQQLWTRLHELSPHLDSCIRQNMERWGETRKSVVKVHLRFSNQYDSQWGILRIYIDLFPRNRFEDNPPHGVFYHQPRGKDYRMICDHHRLSLNRNIGYDVADATRAVLKEDREFSGLMDTWQNLMEGESHGEFHLYYYMPFPV